MALTVTPVTQFTAVLEGAATGLTGTVAVRIVDALDDSIVLPRQTTGIAEAVAGSGVYEAQLVSPTTPGEYLIVWDDGGTSPADFASEPLTVGGVAPAPTVTVPPGTTSLRLPQRNATITSVEVRSAVEDWDRVTTRSAVWTGKADAYITVASRRVSNPGNNSDDVETTRVVLVPRLLPVDVGSRLTITSDSGTSENVRVQTIDRRLPPPGVEAPIRLTGEVD